MEETGAREERPEEHPVEAPEPSQAAAPEDTPSKRPRGRPPGAKHKPRVQVVPIEAPPPPPEPTPLEEPAEPVVIKRRAPRAQPMAPAPPAAPTMDHHTILQYMASYVREQTANSHKAKHDHYSKLIEQSFR